MKPLTKEQIEEQTRRNAEFQEQERPPQAQDGTLDVRAYLGHYGIDVIKEKPHGSSVLYCIEKCLFDESHKMESAIGQAADGKLFYQCFHTSCKSRTWHDARQIISGNDRLGRFIPGYENQKQTGGCEPGTKADENWPEPINIFDELSIADPIWQPDYCPSVISDFALDEAERMGVRPEQIAGPAIISAAGIIDDRIQLQPKRYDETWTESARLWGAIIGGSGEKKSPSKNRADIAINEIEKDLYRRHCDLMRLYEVELQQYEALSKKERSNISPPLEPIRERVICNDTTVEALRDILCDGGGATKITCLWDELSGMLATFDAYRQSGKGVSRDRALYLELFNGGSKPIDRSGKVNIFVPNWSACISGTITPEVMSEYFGKLNADGLLQRFLLYRAERLGRGVDRAQNQVAERRFKSTIKRLFDHKPNGDVTVRLSDEAQAIRDSFETLVDLAYHLPGNTPAFNAHLNKYPGLFCRLCLTYHMLACFDAESPKMSLTVSGTVAEMTAKALIEYHLPAAREFYNRLGFASRDQEAAKDLCGFILAKGGEEISARDITRSVWSLKKDSNTIREAAALLCTYGWLRVSKLANGKPTRWTINPAVHQMFAEHAKRERARRTEVHAKIKEAASTFKRGN